MSGYFIDAAAYLINLIFGLYLVFVALRLLLQWVRADSYNPVSRFLIITTEPVLKPIRRYIFAYKGIDFAAIVLMLILQLLEICFIALLTNGHIPATVGLPVIIVSRLLELIIYIYIFVIIIQIIISWLQPVSYSPLTVLLYQLSQPLFKPIRRYVPVTAGIDWSPLVALVVLNLMLILLVAPLHDWGIRNI